ncbi:DNA replication factor GINS [Halorhabdus sp. SVX81]|uniref:DNA replication complex subunit Gins51 n=1 Tax=Halorhabdus sp. SVX81 TaxID=2978283 RepID=UPI0023DA26C3|nr:hypothetical protein [Halorhabdus sp. SVX81]WEL17990.1 DNA replication factor GINS [Halorhabdus sp. SVX81]
MDLDEIQSVQSRERQTDSLQQLRDSFYEEAGQFVRSLRAERERAAEAADDPFDSPKVTRLSDDIDTAEQTLQAIYERRVGKVVKMASLAAADMPTEEEGLTTEERDLFADLVSSIESNRQRVFDVLDGDSMSVAGNSEPEPSVEDSPPSVTDEGVTAQPDTAGSTTASQEPAVPPMEPDEDGPTPESDEVPAAELMGTDSTPEASPADPDVTSPSAPAENAKAPAAGSNDDGSDPTTRRDGGPPDSTDGGVERTTVRITSDVGEILGVDDRTYDLVAEDVVTLPATNAEPLVERGVAETLQ